MIPRNLPYAKVQHTERVGLTHCVTDDWENGDPFNETMFHHIANIMPSQMRGSEYPDAFQEATK